MMRFRSLPLLGVYFMLVFGSCTAVADDSSTQQGGDGFHVTPELLTPSASSSASSSTGNSSTLGLEYNFQKTIPVNPYSVPYQLPQCMAGCSHVWGVNGQVSGSGKVAADSKVDVGDLIDFAGTFGSEYYYFGTVPLPGQSSTTLPITADSTLVLKASFEGGQRLSTHQYTYGVSSSDTLAPIGGPKWFARVSWPTVVLEFSRVDPTGDTARKLVDPALEAYNRWHVRVSVGVKVGTFQGRALRVDAKYDHWQEVSPSEAIVAAHLGAQTYRAYSFVFVGRGSAPDWVVTYASGNVPTDQTASKVWQLGWRWNFTGKGG